MSTISNSGGQRSRRMQSLNRQDEAARNRTQVITSEIRSDLNDSFDTVNGIVATIKLVCAIYDGCRAFYQWYYDTQSTPLEDAAIRMGLYTRAESDFTNVMVQESRALIVEAKSQGPQVLDAIVIPWQDDVPLAIAMNEATSANGELLKAREISSPKPSAPPLEYGLPIPQQARVVAPPPEPSAPPANPSIASYISSAVGGFFSAITNLFSKPAATPINHDIPKSTLHILEDAAPENADNLYAHLSDHFNHRLADLTRKLDAAKAINSQETRDIESLVTQLERDWQKIVDVALDPEKFCRTVNVYLDKTAAREGYILNQERRNMVFNNVNDYSIKQEQEVVELVDLNTKMLAEISERRSNRGPTAL